MMKRRPGLVDENVVDLVHDREVEWALHLLAGFKSQIVAQVVKAEFAVGSIGDVTLVGFLPADGPEMPQPFVGGSLVGVLGIVHQ